MPIATVSTSCNSASEASKYGVLINIYVTRKATNPPCSQFNPVNCSSVSDEVSAHAEWTTGSRPNEEATLTPTNPTLGYRTLSAFTLYGELSVACTPEDFASVCARLQQEWSFDAGFVSRFTASCAPQLPAHSLHIAHSYCCVSFSLYVGDSVLYANNNG